jgi:hypothetical protein
MNQKKAYYKYEIFWGIVIKMGTKVFCYKKGYIMLQKGYKIGYNLGHSYKNRK